MMEADNIDASLEPAKSLNQETNQDEQAEVNASSPVDIKTYEGLYSDQHNIG